MKISLTDYLKARSYPGRGIMVGKSEDGAHSVVAYFIMGRSENSRNRVFVEHENGIKTKAFDEAKLIDPSLIIYSPVRVLGDTQIITNGDQTDTVYDFIAQGKSFEDALRTRTFEPDAPNFTPRISAVLKGDCAKMSILKSGEGDSDYAQRFFFEYTPLKGGEGRIIHTYSEDVNPLPSFVGEPTPVLISGDIDTFTKNVWDALNDDNKVSLFVRYTNLKTGEALTKIINKLA